MAANNSVNNTIGTATTTTSLSRVNSAAGQWDGYDDQTDVHGYYSGAGTPEAVVAADIGSIYTDTGAGITGTYYKSTDTANTGWLPQINSSTEAWHYVSRNTIASNVIVVSTPASIGPRWFFSIDTITTGINGSNFYLEISIDDQVSWINTGYLGGMNVAAYNSATIANVNSAIQQPLARTVNFTGSGTGAVTGWFWIDTGLFDAPLVGETSYWDNTTGTVVRGNLIGQLPNPSTIITDIRISASSNLSVGRVNAFVLRGP